MKFDSWEEKYNVLSQAKANGMNIGSADDQKWLAEQNEALKDQAAVEACKDGDSQAGDYIMQKYGVMGRLFGIGIKKTNKYNW